VVTLLDTEGSEVDKKVAKRLDERLKIGSNKVLWLGNREVVFRTANQYNNE